MGDVGSGALGFALGCLLSIAVWRATAADAALSSALLLALPVSAFLVDATLTLAGRILRREQWWTPHVQHAYQAAARQVRTGQVVNPVDRGHIAFRTDDLDAVKRRLDEKGIKYSDYGDWAMTGWKQIFFYDPDGNVVEVHQAPAEVP